MKFHFIGSIAFYAIAAMFFAFSGMTELALVQRKTLWYLSFIPMIAGLVESIVFSCRLIDKFEHIDKLKQVADRIYLLQKDLAKANSELRDINRHICDGFNGVVEIMSDRQAV